jgi:UDP-N-acetylmuramate dehydrogenase
MIPLTDVETTRLAQRLRAELRGEVRTDVPLAPLTTYRLGGPAALALTPLDVEDLARAVALLVEHEVPWEVLGGGSNVLVADRGFRGAVVLTSALDRLELGPGETLIAGAGVDSHQVALAALDAGLSGVEFLAWLPGSIGGACLMNARAYGGEISGVMRAARCVRRGDGGLEELALAPEHFSYKRSHFGERGLIVAEATFALTPGDVTASKEQIDFIEAARRKNHEMDHPSCGCVFKNDYSVGISSGKLIDACGLKGLRVGQAQVSAHHANFVVNLGDASAADVRAVIERVHEAVREETGHDLEREVQLLGDWD